MSFEGKVILLTGASNGIGAAAAEFFAKEGAFLSLVGRNAQRFEKVIEKIKEIGVEREPLVILADVTVDAERIMSETIEKYGKLDILINNAGFGNYGSIEVIKMEDFDAVMATNVRAVIELSHLAVPYLKKTKGNIVNSSSIVGVSSFHNFLAYSMSKAALDQFTKCSALDLGPKGIRVNSINPGFIDTDFHHLDRNSPEYAALAEKGKAWHPIGRIGQLDDCVNAIAFLAHEKASFITGHLLLVDGGIGRKGVF